MSWKWKKLSQVLSQLKWLSSITSKIMRHQSACILILCEHKVELQLLIIWVIILKGSMQHLFDQLEKFMATANCIFEFKAIDYPSAFQQHLIVSYFQINNLIKSTSHSDIVRLLHSSMERQLDVFLPGLLYSMLLDFHSASSLFQTYMPILRNESWVGLDRLLQQLLKDSLNLIKPIHRGSIISILAKLNYFGQLSGDLLVLAIKIIDAFDLSQNTLNFNNTILNFFQHILAHKTEHANLKEILAEHLFYKLLRMLSLLNSVDDDNVREYRNRCVSLTYNLFQYSKDKCLHIGWGAAGVMRELQRDQAIKKLVEQSRDELIRNVPVPENPVIASLKLGLILPFRVQSTIKFIIKQEISQLQIGLQLNWLFFKAEQHFQLLLVDILKYILALPNQDLPLNQCLYLLEWLFYRSCNNNILFQVWKSELFHSCFCEPSPYPFAPQRALRFLSYLLEVNFQFGETLLVYLLRQASVPEYGKRVQQLLLQANTLNILNINFLLTHSRLSPRAKSQLRLLFGDASFGEVEKFKQEQAQPYYSPFEQIQRKQSDNMEIQFSNSESNENFQGYDEEEIQNQSSQKPKGIKIKIQKMFAQDLGERLTTLLMQPNMLAYKQFFKKLIDEIKIFKLNGQVQIIELFLNETAKITYLIFQNQFEDHSTFPSRDENVIAYLLSVMLAEWKTHSLTGQSCKKIIRKIVQHFPTSEPGIWRQFLLNFRKGSIPLVRQLKDWLIPRQKIDYAVSLLRELGSLSRQVYENAEQLKLPIV